MAKEYKVGEKYYLPVTVKENDTDHRYPITLEFVDCESRNTTDSANIADEPDLLLTAEDIAMVINTERDDALAELKARNAELEALLKEVMATRDEAIRQNDELLAENSKLKSDCNDWKDTADDRITDVQTLTAERDNLKADLTTQKKVNEELKAWYEEANKTASEAAEANDELKAKIADLRNRVGEQLAQIQDLNAEVHFLNAEKEQEAKAEKTVHVVLNDGTGYNFLKCTKASFDNYADFSVLKIYRGEEYVAGFMRGDKPGNFAYWWTE